MSTNTLSQNSNTPELHRCLQCQQVIEAPRNDKRALAEHKATEHPRMKRTLFYSLLAER